MEISCRCPACRAKLRIAPKHAGKTIRCPRCQEPVEVPAVDSDSNADDKSASSALPSEVIAPPIAPPSAAPAGPPQPPAVSPPELEPPPIVTAPLASADDSFSGFPAIEIHPTRDALVGGPPRALRSRSRGVGGRPTSVLPLMIAGGILLLAGGVLIGWYLSQGIDQTGATTATSGAHGGATEKLAPIAKRPGVEGTALASADGSNDGAVAERKTEVAGVRGFEGWLTNLDAAKKQAAADKQEIAIVFGCSDAQPATQELAQALQEPSANNVLGQCVRVVIDIPRMPTDRDQFAENRRLMQEFGLTRLPAVALADEQGRPYVLEKRFEYGFERLADKLEQWQKQRIDRDRLLAAAEKGSEADQLGAASITVKWLQEYGVWMFYRPEIRKWYELAQRLDPKNEQRLLEAIFEPYWMARVGETNVNDAADVLQVADELKPWTERRFDDADRGARLHLAAVRLLTDARKFDEAAQHMELAVKYQPRDARLADAIRNVRQHLDNKEVSSSGTGFVVASGYVVTNQHVIDGPGDAVIRIPGQKETLAVEVIAQDAAADLALLKVTATNPPPYRPLPLRADAIGRGTAVAAFGFPLGDTLGSELKFTSGAVSALPDESNNQMYLLDVRINPGNSGGPLCDQRGNVVGMVTAKTDTFGAQDSYGLAIPSPAISRFIDQHLPPSASRPLADTNDSPLTWEIVDERVSSGVLKVLKKKP